MIFKHYAFLFLEGEEYIQQEKIKKRRISRRFLFQTTKLAFFL